MTAVRLSAAGVTAGNSFGYIFADWTIPAPIRVLPCKAVLRAGSTDNSLRVLVDTPVPFEQSLKSPRQARGRGLVSIEKGYVAKTPMTTLSLTKEGRSGIERHWKRLDQLRASTLQWQPEG